MAATKIHHYGHPSEKSRWPQGLNHFYHNGEQLKPHESQIKKWIRYVLVCTCLKEDFHGQGICQGQMMKYLLKKALTDYFCKVRKTVWIDIIKKDFKHLNFTDGNRRLWMSWTQKKSYYVEEEEICFLFSGAKIRTLSASVSAQMQLCIDLSTTRNIDIVSEAKVTHALSGHKGFPYCYHFIKPNRLILLSLGTFLTMLHRLKL